MKVRITCMIFITSMIWSYRQPYIPLFGAAKLGSKKYVHHLLACGQESPNQTDELKNTPLHYAVHTGSKEVTNELLKFNAIANVKNNKGKTPLHIAVQQGNDYIARRLMTYGADPNCADNNGNTPLHIAAQNNNRLHAYRIICDLLDFGADASIKNNNGKTPLLLAQHICTQLINVNSAYKQQKNAQRILYALQKEHKKVPFCTPLDKQYQHIAKTTHVEQMQHILQCPAININQQFGTQKRTALMYAAKNNRTAMVDYLINDAHVDKTLKDAQNKTAYDYAKKHNNPTLHKLLKIR